jgi:hypothetical protein
MFHLNSIFQLFSLSEDEWKKNNMNPSKNSIFLSKKMKKQFFESFITIGVLEPINDVQENCSFVGVFVDLLCY